MSELSKLFMYIPGIILFLVGSGQVREWLRFHVFGRCLTAKVVSCNHVLKKDGNGREIYNYYNLLVEYVSPDSGHKERCKLKTPTQCAVGQQMKMCIGKKDTKPYPVESELEHTLHPIVMMLMGAFLILLALEENQGKEVPAAICLAAIFLLSGGNLIGNYIVLKKKNLKRVCGEIIQVYERQISKETKILKGSKYTYYPIVKYEIDGKENIRRCYINSSSKNSFQVGGTFDLYYDPVCEEVYEKHDRKAVAIAGGVLVVTGLLVGASIVSVLGFIS